MTTLSIDYPSTTSSEKVTVAHVAYNIETSAGEILVNILGNALQKV
jgi:hypothetical protein